ncbi:hypothetical protein [Sediminibacillus albus]|uniref:Uncharacterized protein n=1 Tax=Sediminibacillus albus TaxID=407036 RepID=A0A1G9BAP4_9BACI|nr:hypothetical protein [Sediminibacillus albus]SDK35945.1 hypothetical protein SAMN05216243_2881 [Sediminibacillus albus]
MKHLDWHMILFVGTSLAHDYWLYWGLPRIYFWDVHGRHKKTDPRDDANKAA